MIPEHARVEPYGACYRTHSVQQCVLVGNLPIGVLHELGSDKWGFDDAILGRIYNWNNGPKEMRAFLAKRCRPDFPTSQVARLFQTWQALWDAEGRFGPKSEAARVALNAAVDGISENPE
jgi:hypothetical protein